MAYKSLSELQTGETLGLLAAFPFPLGGISWVFLFFCIGLACKWCGL